jgi:hypothetical protein
MGYQVLSTKLTRLQNDEEASASDIKDAQQRTKRLNGKKSHGRIQLRITDTLFVRALNSSLSNCQQYSEKIPA